MEINKLITLQINAHGSDEKYEIYIEAENNEGLICIFFPSMECASLRPFDIKNTFDSLVSYNEMFSKILYRQKHYELELSISNFTYVGCGDETFYVKRGKFTEEEIIRMRRGEVYR